MPTVTYHAEYAWLGPTAGLAQDTRIDVDTSTGRITAVTPAAPPAGTRLPGLTLPGLANAHSHAFHRGLRGRTHTGRGTFWTWRERMYALAARLDPDSYHDLARAVYGEMALAGITCVGEFHYLHHRPDGGRYADPNAMGQALIAAAGEAGIRITLLDTLYLTSTVDGAALVGPQVRFGDGDMDSYGERHALLRAGRHCRIGIAAHSVRAVPAAAIATLAGLADSETNAETNADANTDANPTGAAVPLHAHLSEQRAENEACQARYGRTPTQVLYDSGALGAGTTVVHATHLSDVDRALLGDTGTGVCLCPTTERDLADGIGPARDLADAGSPLCLGSDSHAVIDMFEEARATELDERLRTEHRGHFSPAELLGAATVAGHRALGWPDAGTLAPGARADLVTVDLTSVRTAGAEPLAAAVFAASTADVRHVVVDGRVVVRDGRHSGFDVAAELARCIDGVTR